MSADTIEEIKYWLARNARLSVGEANALLSALEKAEEERDAACRRATAAETLKRLPTIRDPEIHEAMMEVERAFGRPGDEAEPKEAQG